MEITQQLAQALVHWGADFYGVADLAPAKAAILQQGGPDLAAFPRAVSIGIALFHPIVDQLPRRAEHAVAVSYRRHCYDLVNQRLDLVASQGASFLQRLGFRAYPIPASGTVDTQRLLGAFSHKLAAHLAGLGWIGKSCLLVTPQAGPRVRWATVLTDAPLPACQALVENGCGDCQACVEICPVQAFTGRPFHPAEPRELRFDAHRCAKYFDELKAGGADPAVCGMCLYVCPYGKP